MIGARLVPARGNARMVTDQLTFAGLASRAPAILAIWPARPTGDRATLVLDRTPRGAIASRAMCSLVPRCIRGIVARAMVIG